MSTLVTIKCGAGCGDTDRVPSFEDRAEIDPAKRVKTVQVHPWICLACWRKGWRHDGEAVYHVAGENRAPK